MNSPDHRLCIAPMMSHTDRHFRYLLRLISRHVMLYTEMVPTGALLHGPAHRQLRHHPAEHPLAIQLGGSDPRELARCAVLAQEAGFAEVNLNVGCPSDRVQNGGFGACLMYQPGRVAECVGAMAAEVTIPVTVKTRTGVDDSDSYEFLRDFVGTVAAAGCRTFQLHARKAILRGLNPRQNRLVPPLDHEKVYRIKRDFPDLEIIINGGLATLEDIERQYQRVDGVMIGRAACNDPYLLATADNRIFGSVSRVPGRLEVLQGFLEYTAAELARGGNLGRICRHLPGLFRGLPGARACRRFLSEHIHSPDSGIEVLQQALQRLQTTHGGGDGQGGY